MAETPFYDEFTNEMDAVVLQLQTIPELYSEYAERMFDHCESQLALEAYLHRASKSQIPLPASIIAEITAISPDLLPRNLLVQERQLAYA